MQTRRLEFMTTYHCSGRCRHCSVGGLLRTGNPPYLNAARAAEAVGQLAGMEMVESVMTFGGEPLLYPDVVCSIHRRAMECGIPSRELITNGFFTRDPKRIRSTVDSLAASGVNTILLSVDAFHQETIPLGVVRLFAQAVRSQGFGRFQLQPAWVVDADHDNEYNAITRRILHELSDLNIDVSDGNVVFMAGSAKENLAVYYAKPRLDLSMGCGQMPYTAPLTDIRSLSVVPNGDVRVCHFTIGNINTEDMRTITDGFNPYGNELMKALIEHGVQGLVDMASERGLEVDTRDAYSVCDVCRSACDALLGQTGRE